MNMTVMESWEIRLAGRQFGSKTGLDLFREAKGICYLCNEPIDPLQPPRSSRALSFDHVNHKQKGNPVRPAHRGCNSRKREFSSTHTPVPTSNSVSYAARLEPEVYAGLRLAAVAEGTSANTLLNSLTRSYLQSPQGMGAMKRAASEMERDWEAIRKLSGD